MTRNSSRREFGKCSTAAVAGVIVLPQTIHSRSFGVDGMLPHSDCIAFVLIGPGS